MKKSWVVGSVVAGHFVLVSLLLTQGCQTVQSGRRTAITEFPSAAAPQPAPSTALSRPTEAVTPDGRPIPPASEVGKRGTYKEVVVPRTPAMTSSAIVTTPSPRPQPQPRPAPELPSVVKTYTVAKGDSLGHIAQRHGVTTRDLVRLNQINEPNKLLVGQVLNIPAATQRATASPAPSAVKAPAGGTTHKVAAGESVSVIAQQYGVKTADLLQANSLSRESVIRVGQTLVIPGAKTSAASTPPRDSVKPPVPAPPPPPPPPVPPAIPLDPPVPSPGVLPIPSVTPAPPVVPSAPKAPAVGTPAGEPKYKTYTVKENEDVYSVAISRGIPPSELRQLNNLTSSELTPGQVLRLPE